MSKEEFLDTKTFTFGDKPINISFPRIILSNIESIEDYNHSKIKIRTDNHAIKSESLIQEIIEKYKPIIGAFLESKFSGIANRIITDLSEDPFGFILPIISAFLSGEGEGERVVIEFLHKYNLIGNHITNYEQLGEYLEKEAFNKNVKNALSEQNMWALLELLKSVKDRYVTEIYKSLHNSNQVLVSSFHDIDNFSDRLKLFSMLYDAKIIKPSKEDSFLECTSCEPDTYRGVFSLKINPIKLKKIKCPICNSAITFYVPYELDPVIFDLIKEKDGMILHALQNLLKEHRIKFKVNINALNDIEIDCIYKIKKEVFVVECKMYKQNTTQKKLESKIKEHFSKLIKDIRRIQDDKNDRTESTTPILLVNIHDSKLLNNILNKLKKANKDELYQKGKILTINEIPIK
ncbi:MAG: hypothetical protein JNJ41_14440 [Bacteroidia bacterium]|nr:hypothetical protein [Bacteroidia bacterium]